MCWNIEVSAASAMVGWVACALLLKRGGPRDAYYARYLFTYTFTQFIDIVLWSIHEKQGNYPALQSLQTPGGLTACQEYQYSFTPLPEDHPQRLNYLVTKYALPAVVMSQYFMQCTYPSKWLNTKAWHRPLLIALQFVPVFIMSFCFACTHLVPSLFPKPENTLNWGGDWGWSMKGLAKGEGVTEYWMTQIFSLGSAVHVSIIFWAIMPTRVFLMHIATLACVVSFQAVTEGTIGLGSKWCTYCLIYSAVYLADPLWMPKQKSENGGLPMTNRKADAPTSSSRGALRRRA